MLLSCRAVLTLQLSPRVSELTENEVKTIATQEHELEKSTIS